MLVCTVLPTYNERDNIVPLIERLLKANDDPYMVLVVDDNSPDGTWQAVEALQAKYNHPDVTKVALVRRTNEKGLTSAIQRGIDTAINDYSAEVVTWMDCDLSMPPEDVPRIVAALRNTKADVALGSRWVKGGKDIAHTFMARTLSQIINGFARVLVSNQVHDYTSGFIAARAPVLQKIRLQGDYGEYCIDFLGRAVKQSYEVIEVPYICVPREAGESKTGLTLWDYLSKGRHYVTTIVRVAGR
jgi:dolichol-phosphate mannosyltransferase